VYPELLFLGTGSAMPNKVRNVSAIWLNLRYALVIFKHSTTARFHENIFVWIVRFFAISFSVCVAIWCCATFTAYVFYFAVLCIKQIIIAINNKDTVCQ